MQHTVECACQVFSKRRNAPSFRNKKENAFASFQDSNFKQPLAHLTCMNDRLGQEGFFFKNRSSCDNSSSETKDPSLFQVAKCNLHKLLESCDTRSRGSAELRQSRIATHMTVEQEIKIVGCNARI